jgi:tRNA(Ile)-lysidine synthase
VVAKLDPAVAAVRAAVRRIRPMLPATEGTGPLVLVACSGGPDSMALAAAAGFVLPRQGVRVGLVTVDHQLQAGSADRARRVEAWAHTSGLTPVRIATVSVAGRTGGPEAAARQARYAALSRAAREHGAAAVLLGHTRDDQAETVLLALVRGAGPRGLAAMPVRRSRNGVTLLRPLLDVSRAQAAAACRAEGLPVWHDPHNADPAYRRTHARALLADLAERLGPAVVGNLARTARLVAADTSVLDVLARRASRRVVVPGGLSVSGLVGLPDAVRTRVLHRWAVALGAPRSALSHRHVAALDALVTEWHGQGAVSLPGGRGVVRRQGVLVAGDHPATPSLRPAHDTDPPSLRPAHDTDPPSLRPAHDTHPAHGHTPPSDTAGLAP